MSERDPDPPTALTAARWLEQMTGWHVSVERDWHLGVVLVAICPNAIVREKMVYVRMLYPVDFL